MQNILVNLNKHAYGDKEKATNDHTVENPDILQGEWSMVYGMQGMGGIDDKRVSQDSHLQE